MRRIPWPGAGCARRAAGNHLCRFAGRAGGYSGAITWVRSATYLADYLHNTIDPIPGIGRIRYELTHRMIKHDYRLTTITR